MKKLSLALMAIMTLSISAYLVSCKKETEPKSELPAIQKIRDAAIKNWEVAGKSLLSIDVTVDQKLKEEFKNYETDTTISVTCRVRFKDTKEEVLLPYVGKSLSSTKYYFYSLSGGKPKIFFHNTAVEDFNVSGTSSALPIETVTIVYEKMGIH